MMNRIAMAFLFLPALAAAYLPSDPPLLTTGEFVEEICNSDADIAQGVCLGFVAGVTSSMQNYCVPESIGIEDLSDLVVAEVSIAFRNEQAAESAREAIIDAIMRRWPCDE